MRSDAVEQEVGPMTEAPAPIQHLTAGKVATWYQHDDVEMAVGDAVDPGSSAPLVIGYARYRKGATNQLTTLPYDEALIITRGVFTVRRADGVATARAGEVIFHRAGATVIYQADEDAEMVYVSYPALAMEQAGTEAGGGFHPATDGLVARLASGEKAS
jgi:ethanolamine utilization protein EutQ